MGIILGTCRKVSMLTPEDWSYEYFVTTAPSLNHLRVVSLVVFVTFMWKYAKKHPATSLNTLV